jgi:hypothetical protein
MDLDVFSTEFEKMESGLRHHVDLFFFFLFWQDSQLFHIEGHINFTNGGFTYVSYFLRTHFSILLHPVQKKKKTLRIKIFNN